MFRHYGLVVAVVILANALMFGCASQPILKDIQKPDAALMAPPKPLPPLKVGATLEAVTINNAQVRGVCVADQNRFEQLQLYVLALVGG